MSRRFLIPLLALPVLALGTLGVGVAVAGGPFAHGCPFHGGGDHHAKAEAMLDKALSEIGATDEQSAEIEGIVDDAHTRLEAMHEGMEEHHESVNAVLTAETIDRAALETLRQEGLAHFDEASAMFVEVIADVAEVLTQEQREELAELAESHRPM